MTSPSGSPQHASTSNRLTHPYQEGWPRALCCARMDHYEASDRYAWLRAAGLSCREACERAGVHRSTQRKRVALGRLQGAAKPYRYAYEVLQLAMGREIEGKPRFTRKACARVRGRDATRLREAAAVQRAERQRE